MFTGIVRASGRVVSFAGSRLVVEAELTAPVGDSIAVNGVCLTVVGCPPLSFDVVPETLERTTLGRLRDGDGVNLEPAARVGDPLGGHIVQGHVDGVGSVRAVDDALTWFDAPSEILRYVVFKGSIAVDGVSLTVAAVDERGFAVALIPHTREVTTLGGLTAGSLVNLEADALAKYVERLTVRA
jgi:riboflavin synthase alpha subunit